MVGLNRYMEISARKKPKDNAKVRNQLINAIHRGDTLQAALAVEQLTNVNFLFEKRPVLCVAVEHGDLGIIKLLLDRGADVNMTDKASAYMDKEIAYTPLHIAVKKGHYDVVEMLIKHDALVDTCYDGSRNATMLAVFNSDLPILELLLKHGVKPDNALRNALYQSVLSKRPTAENKISMLDLCFSYHPSLKCDYEFLGILVKYALKTSETSVLKYILSVSKGLVHFITDSEPTSLLSQYLVESEANLSRHRLNTPSSNNTVEDMVTVLRSFDIDITNILYQNSPLVFALIKQGNDNCHLRNYLLMELHDLNIKDARGNTLIHVALKYRNLTLVLWLLQHGASLKEVNSDGQSGKSMLLSIYEKDKEGLDVFFPYIYHKWRVKALSSYNKLFKWKKRSHHRG